MKTMISAFAAVLLLAASAASHAVVITFDGPGGQFDVADSEVTQGIFSYDVFSGVLFHQTGGILQGRTDDGGGTMRLVRNDVSGGTFTFDGLDIANFSGAGGATNISVFGYLGGVLQAEDVFTTSSVSSVFTTVSASLLSGTSIDELRITLDAGLNPQVIESIDNLVLNGTRVPEPVTLALFGLGLAGLGAARRKA